MKTKLLLLLLVSTLGYSQSDIEAFQSATGSQYHIVTGSINQSAIGANVSWDFSDLTASSTLLTDTYIDTPPTSVIRTSEGLTLISEIGLNTSAGELSITSALSSGVQLNYSNSAIIGTFPLSFGYSNTDSVEGAFTGPVSGSVLSSSTINTDVDAWGTLKMGTFNGSVTRLKIVQNLNLLVGGIVPTTGTQISYFYYDANSDDLVFRSTRLIVPLAGIDDTIMESLSSYTLSIKTYQINKADIKLVTNPVKDVLRLRAIDFIEIKTITISDVSGRVLLKVDGNETAVDVSQLKTGVLIASVTTQNGIWTTKFIKQ